MTDLTEKVSRAICVAETGHDSDWRDYSDAAREAIHVVNEAEADEIDRLRAALQTIVDSYDARSELYTNDADCAGNLADHARAALQRDTE